MSDEKECEICQGSGRALIFDQHGNERYSVKCPHCLGDGIEPPPDEPDAGPTAADLKYIEWKRTQLSSQNGDPKI